MPIKKIVNSLDEVAEELRSHYTKRGDKFVLDVEGDDDTTALRNAKDREKARADEEASMRRDAEKRERDLQRKLDEATNSPETARLTSELEKATKDRDTLREGIIRQARDSQAHEIAASISKAPKLLARVLADRLHVELDTDGKPVVKPLGPDGKPSDAFTVDSLKKEIAENKDYADIIIASKAGGGGAPRHGVPGSHGAHGGGAALPNDQTPSLASLSPTALAAHLKAKREAEAS